MENKFLEFYIFLLSGLVHVVVNVKLHPDIDPFGESRFLLLSFAVGSVESMFLTGFDKGYGVKVIVYKLLGFLWVFAFFYGTSPPCQYSLLRQQVVTSR
jgi:hypothetical protein